MDYQKFLHPVIVVTVLSLLLIGCGTPEIKVENKIEGKITQDGNPSVGIVVELAERESTSSPLQQTQTDVNGHFAFQDVSPGSYKIRVPVEINGEINCTFVKWFSFKAGELTTLDIEVPTNDPTWSGISILEDGSLDYSTICRE